MARTTSILFLLVAAISAISAAPVAGIQARATTGSITFIPDAGPGCDMSTNPFDTTKPVDYNITAPTSSGCITPPYAFNSYVVGTYGEAAGACALSLFSGPSCTGSKSAGQLPQSGYTCVAGSSSQGQSFSFTC